MPENLDQLAAFAAEHVEIAAVRIALEGFLHQQGQGVHAAAHVGVARRNPHPTPRRNWDHRRRPSASAATAAVNIAGSTAPVISIRAPLANSISMTPPAIQLARMNAGVPRKRRYAGTRLQRCRYQLPLLRRAPAPPSFNRGDDLNAPVRHVTIPMNTHMTHTIS